MTSQPCFAHDLVRVQEEEGLSDAEAAYTAGSLLQGGLGSTTETLTGFVKAMVMFPEVGRAAQAEVDRVCGERMPDLDDWASLSYVRGCVKETLRWMPASPLGIPHALTREDEYLGYRLPKGATVLYNVRYVVASARRFCLLPTRNKQFESRTASCRFRLVSFRRANSRAPTTAGPYTTTRSAISSRAPSIP